jgi:hypothetical protein
MTSKGYARLLSTLATWGYTVLSRSPSSMSTVWMAKKIGEICSVRSQSSPSTLPAIRNRRRIAARWSPSPWRWAWTGAVAHRRHRRPHPDRAGSVWQSARMGIDRTGAIRVRIPTVPAPATRRSRPRPPRRSRRRAVCDGGGDSGRARPHVVQKRARCFGRANRSVQNDS